MGNVIASPVDGCFKMVFKKGNDWENVIFGGDQDFSVTEKENGLEFIVNKVSIKNVKVDISLKLAVSLEGEDLIFDAEIVNNEADTLITDFDYPVIGTIKTLAGGKPALLWPKQCGQKYINIGDYLTRIAPSGKKVGDRISMTYPADGSMQWMVLEDKDQVLYFSCHDSDFYSTELRVTGSDSDPGAVTLTIDKMPFIKCGEAWKAPSSVIKLYTGTWHHGVQDYIDWSKNWRKTHYKPKWVKDMMGYYLVINKQQYGKEMWKYDTLPQLYKLAVETGCDTLGLFGWYDSGHDNQYPELKASDSLGGEQALKENIKKVQEEGGNVTLYFQGHLIDVTTSYYKNFGCNYEAKNRWGVPYYEQHSKYHYSSFLKNYTFKTFATACKSCPEWQQLLEEKTDFIASFGPNGVLFDQIGGMPPRPCFDDRHPHVKGKPSLSESNGRMKLLDRIQTRTKKIDKEFAFFTEHITDIYSSYVDCLHGIDSFPSREGNRLDAEINREKTQVINYPELFRYCFPDVIITVRNPYPYIAPRVANYAFVFGFRYEMEVRYQQDCEEVLSGKYEEYNQYAKKVTELRKKYWDVLGYGEFKDSLPVINSNPAVIAKAYVKDNKLVVAMWNDTDKDAVVALKVNGYKLLEFSTVDAVLPEIPEKLSAQQIAIALYEKI